MFFKHFCKKEFSESEKLTEEKIAFRKKMRKKINDFISDKEKGEDEITKSSSAFLESDFYKNAGIIFAFISCKNEISTARIIAKSIQDAKRVAVPKVIPGTNKMDFYLLEKLPLNVQTKPGEFGIPEPCDNLKKVNLKRIPKNAVVLMPGLAFSFDGSRIGKGKGFYDVFLSELAKNENFKENGVKIGYCFDFQLQKNIPHGEKDQKADWLLAGGKLIKCSL